MGTSIGVGVSACGSREEDQPWKCHRLTLLRKATAARRPPFTIHNSPFTSRVPGSCLVRDVTDHRSLMTVLDGWGGTRLLRRIGDRESAIMNGEGKKVSIPIANRNRTFLITYQGRRGQQGIGW